MIFRFGSRTINRSREWLNIQKEAWMDSKFLMWPRRNCTKYLHVMELSPRGSCRPQKTQSLENTPSPINEFWKHGCCCCCCWLYRSKRTSSISTYHDQYASCPTIAFRPCLWRTSTFVFTALQHLLCFRFFPSLAMMMYACCGCWPLCLCSACLLFFPTKKPACYWWSALMYTNELCPAFLPVCSIILTGLCSKQSSVCHSISCFNSCCGADCYYAVWMSYQCEKGEDQAQSRKYAQIQNHGTSWNKS
jgi:hypothetical protein